MRRLLLLFSLTFMPIGSAIFYANAQSDGAKKHDFNTLAEDVYEYFMTEVDVLPEFPGGTKALYKWIADSINYPAEAVQEGVEGRVVVEFTVSKNGEIIRSYILRGRHQALNKEALRLVNAMPKWQPGIQNGTPVNVRYTMPVVFKLPPKPVATE